MKENSKLKDTGAKKSRLALVSTRLEGRIAPNMRKLSVLMLFFIISLTACSNNSIMQLSSEQLEIVQPVDLAAADIQTDTFEFYYDITYSMKGFLNNRTQSAYIKSVYEAMVLSEELWPMSEKKYYVYDDVPTLMGDEFRVEYKNPNIFSRNSGKNNVVPLKNLFESIDMDAGTLSVITTDMYEQGTNYLSIVNGFKRAFSHNLSGAVIGVKSEFNGYIYEVGPYGGTINKTGNGNFSRFFFIVLGNSADVAQYTKMLTQRLKQSGVEQAESIYFMNSKNNLGLPQDFKPTLLDKDTILEMPENSAGIRSRYKTLDDAPIATVNAVSSRKVRLTDQQEQVRNGLTDDRIRILRLNDFPTRLVIPIPIELLGGGSVEEWDFNVDYEVQRYQRIRQTGGTASKEVKYDFVTSADFLSSSLRVETRKDEQHLYVIADIEKPGKNFRIRFNLTCEKSSQRVAEWVREWSTDNIDEIISQNKVLNLFNVINSINTITNNDNSGETNLGYFDIYFTD